MMAVLNLRAANKSINALNSKINSKNTSGFKGVSFCNTKRRWKGYIEVNGKKISKYFKTKADAIRFRKDMEAKHVHC